MNSRDRIFEAIQYIEQNLSESFSIAEICTVACYSRFHFQRLFHAATGVTLTEYIQTRRITESGRLLIDSSDSILQIALTYQFKSHQHFSRAFRQLFGMTPSQFRKSGVAVAPKLFEPFTIDDIDLDLDKSGTFLGFVESPEMVVYRKSAVSNAPEAVHTVWQEMRSLFAGRDLCLKGMISYPEQISFDLPYQYAVISPESAEGVDEITLPAVTFAEFRYVGAIQNISNLYRYVYCVWMDKEGYTNPYNFDLEFPTLNFQGPGHDSNEMIIQIPVVKNSTES